MKNIKVMYSKETDNWQTPTEIYELFKNCIDPFPYMSNTDNLNKTYNEPKNIYINPPFSKLKYIPQFVKNNLINNRYIYILMPARTDTIYFHELLNLKPTIIFIKGRLKYNNKGSAPFPSILLKFNQNLMLTTYNYYTKEQLIEYIKKEL